MASIQYKREIPYVVYSEYFNGKRKNVWKRCETAEEAERVKADIELRTSKGNNLLASNQTMSQFMDYFVRLYGEENWSISTYKHSVGVIENYIKPIIGHVRLRDLNRRTVDEYIRTLQRTKAVDSALAKRNGNEFVTNSTIAKTLKVLHCAFEQAVRWEFVESNPFDKPNFKKQKEKRREIWNAEDIRKALEGCKSVNLFVAINLSFACSMRLGEILGLQWKYVHVSDDDISTKNAHLEVVQELAEAPIDLIDKIGSRDIYKVFDSIMGKKNRIILKKPKTDSSIRKIWIPDSLAIYLQHLKERQTLFSKTEKGYKNYGFVLQQTDGRPCSKRMIEKAFNNLKKELNLPDVVFHSLRHSSTTYKLMLSNGDIKATQGDTGHSQATMVLDRYAHILDQERKSNAEKFNKLFYGQSEQNDSISKFIADFTSLVRSNPEILIRMKQVLDSQ